MPKFRVSKSIIIATSPEQAFSSVRDFRQWPAWSPWLITEPETRLEFSNDGKCYAWDGKVTGSGEMAVIGEAPPRAIDCQLTFLKPWKSVNSVGFLFAAREGGTEVTWTMEGTLPFFMFWMKSMMSRFIGADFQRGLMMLKAHLETGTVPSQLAFIGRQSFPGCRYLGVKTRCPIPDLGTHLRKDMGTLLDWLGKSATPPVGKPFSICHKWDLAQNRADFTLAFPLDFTPGSLPAGFVTGAIPACEVFVIRHTGPYRYLGNAWAAGMMRCRAKVFRSDKHIAPFEIYESDPAVDPEDTLVTTLHFPMK